VRVFVYWTIRLLDYSFTGSGMLCNFRWLGTSTAALPGHYHRLPVAAQVPVVLADLDRHCLPDFGRDLLLPEHRRTVGDLPSMPALLPLNFRLVRHLHLETYFPGWLKLAVPLLGPLPRTEPQMQSSDRPLGFLRKMLPDLV
jgi:hypothetical protein